MHLNGFTIHFKQGGGEKALYNLLKKYNKKNFKIFCFKYTQNIDVSDVEIISLKTNGFFYFFRELIDSKKIKILSSLWSSNVVLIFFKIFGILDNILIREGNEVESAIKDSNYIKSLFWMFSIKYLYNYSENIIVMNSCMRKSILNINGNLNNKIKIIPNYIDLKKIISLSNTVIEKKYLYLKNKKIILSIGRLNNQKNYLNLIKGFSIARKQLGVDLKLVIIGQGHLRDKILSLAESLNLKQEIILINFIKNPYNLMKISKLYIMSSHYEGYPNSLVEALIITKNVISSNCRCGPEELFYGENRARLFDPNNIMDISLKIKKYINSNKMDIEFLKNKILSENLIEL